MFSISYVVAVDRTDCKVDYLLGLIKYSESESAALVKEAGEQRQQHGLFSFD